MIWVIISWTVFYSVHSILLLPVVKKSFIKLFNTDARRHRLAYNLISAVLLSIAFYAVLKFPGGRWMNSIYWIEIPGWMLILSSIWLAKRAFRSYSMPEFLGLSEEVQMPLSVKGFNAYVRHPLYTASLLIFWSVNLVYPTYAWLSVSIITSLYVFVGYRLEERRMIEHFGDVYKEYIERVPALIPRFRSTRI